MFASLKLRAATAALACLVMFAASAEAAPPTPVPSSHSGIETAGNVVAIALPVFAAGTSIYKDDWQGVADFAIVTAGTVGTSLLLKQFVHEKRPDGSDFKSFPSDTAALAFAPAFYMWHRYGWEYGIPAVAAASFVGYSRVEAKQHHWYDVAASAAIGFTFDQVFTRRYHPEGFSAGLSATPDGGSIAVDYRF